jgi:predicted deacylase
MLQVQQFGERKTGCPHLLVLGGVHGDEPPGVDAATEFASRLETVSVRGLVTVVPIVNQPAWKQRSRCGPDGLDLARTCPGRSDGSVTEKIAAALSGLIADSTALIDLHSGGSTMEIHPLAGYMMVRDDSVLSLQRAMASAFSLPIIWGTSDQLDGRSLSIARDHHIPALYAEFGSAKSDQRITDAYVDGCMNVAADLDLVDQVGRKRAAENPLVVEETSPVSGHLQICHPAPCDGLYDSQLQLGDKIVVGESIGNVVSAATGERVDVAAEKSGKLIVRRALPEVKCGDSLGVILKWK